MRHAVVVLLAAGLLEAQNGQGPPRPGWPCVAGRPVDPAYLDISESTGGELFMFQRNEAAQSVTIMTASNGYKDTILRSVGNLSGSRDFQFPVDSTVSSLLVMASIQCLNTIRLSRPNGAEFTAAESPSDIELQAGRIIRVDRPESGDWSVRLTGTGLFLFSVLAKSDIALTGISFSSRHNPAYGVAQPMELHLSGTVSNLKFQLVDATGAALSNPKALDSASEGAYTTTITPNARRLRVLITGTDTSAVPFQRIYPILFRADPPK